MKSRIGAVIYGLVKARRLLPLSLDRLIFHAPRHVVSTIEQVPQDLESCLRGEREFPASCGPAIDARGRRWTSLERTIEASEGLIPLLGVIRGGVVLGRQLSVLSPNGDVIFDCSPVLRSASRPGFGNPQDPEQHRALRRYVWLPPPKRISGSLAVVGCAGAGNYYHWLIDALPRLLALRDAGLLDDDAKVAVPRCTLSAIAESLELIGIGSDRTVALGRYSQVQADRLLVATATCHLIGPTQSAIDRLRQAFLGPASNLDPKAIRASEQSTRQTEPSRDQTPELRKREDARSRRLLVLRTGARAFMNDQVIEDSLRPFGFEPLRLEKVRFVDQIAAFRSADVIVAAHGAGLANLVWCSPGSKVLECFSSDYLNPCFRSLSRAAGVDHNFIVSASDRNRLMNVDPAELVDWARSL